MTVADVAQANKKEQALQTRSQSTPGAPLPPYHGTSGSQASNQSNQLFFPDVTKPSQDIFKNKGQPTLCATVIDPDKRSGSAIGNTETKF